LSLFSLQCRLNLLLRRKRHLLLGGPARLQLRRRHPKQRLAGLHIEGGRIPKLRDGAFNPILEDGYMQAVCVKMAAVIGT
jgi:hypothetical protein